MTAPALTTRGLTIGYRRRRKGDLVLARSLCLELARGRLIGLLGPNGVGKSTLLRTLGGLHPALAGRVRLAGHDLARLSPRALARQLSLVLTFAPQPALMTGYGLVALGRQPQSDWLGRLGDVDHAAIAWAISAVGADELAASPLAALSDGQRQKLMIARALAQEAPVMLLDEPTAYLDLPRRVETMQLLKRLAHSAGRAILVSTHDLDLALRSCDQLWLMSATGVVTGAPEDLVLAGALGETFDAAGFRFDQDSGAFIQASSPGRLVCVRGGGAQAIWMRRALERSGYALSDEPGAINVARRNDGETGWKLTIAGRASAHSTIQSVLAALEDGGA